MRDILASLKCLRPSQYEILKSPFETLAKISKNLLLGGKCIKYSSSLKSEPYEVHLRKFSLSTIVTNCNIL